MHSRWVIVRHQNTHTKSTPNKKHNQSSHDGLERPRHRLSRVGCFTSNHRDILRSTHTEAGSVDGVDE